MRKHEVNYHKKIDIIEFCSEFCTHSRKIKAKMTNKEKNISFEKKFFFNQSDHSRFDDSIKNFRKFIKIVTKVLFRKKVCFDQSINQLTNSLFRKNKKSIKFVSKMKILNAIKD